MRILLFALIILVHCSPANRKAAEDTAAETVKKLGGAIIRDKKPERFVIAVELDETNVTDEDLKRLAAFTNLRTLSLVGTPIADASLKELVPLSTTALTRSPIASR